MRNYAISILFLAFTVLSGACAGRQVRTSSIPAPRLAESAVPAPVPAVVAVATDVEEASVIEDAPVQESDAELRLRVQDSIDRYVARTLAEHDASVRAAAERMHRTPVPEPTAKDKEIVAMLKPDATRSRDVGRRKPNARHRAVPEPAPAAEDDGREAVIGSISSGPALTRETPAPAGPSVIPTPPRTPNVLTADSSAQRSESPPLRFPGPPAVKEMKDYASAYLLAAALAGVVGILSGLLLWRRERRLRIIASRPYDHLPDGTLVTHEIVGGVAIAKRVLLPEARASRSEPETPEQAERRTDDLARTWHAEGDAMERPDAVDAAPRNGPQFPRASSPHDLFDLTDAPDKPVTPTDEAPDKPVTPTDDAPRPSPGSGQIVSSADASIASGTTEVPDTPSDARSEPEPSAKVIVYEDGSARSPAQPASTAPN